MKQIILSEEIRSRCPDVVGAALYADVRNTDFCPALWEEIIRFSDEYKARHTPESIKTMPSIQATREAYKRCGKDPSRYRPSGEALVRRILKGNELYQVNTLVDLLNLASIAYGYSIGGFDEDRIEGDTLTLGIGRAEEPYEGIGRGPLNIEGMPVYRDRAGGIGTPTSDNERTKLGPDTRHLLTLVNGYDGNREQVAACARYITGLLQRYAAATDVEINLF